MPTAPRPDSSTSWRPGQAKAFTNEPDLPGGGDPTHAVCGPRGCILKDSSNLRSHRQGHAKDGQPHVVGTLCSRDGVHQTDLDLEQFRKGLLDVVAVGKLWPEFDTDPTPLGTMGLGRTGHARLVQPVLDDRSPRTFKGRAPVHEAMEGGEGQEPPLTLIGLIRTLTAPATAPHLFGFLALTIALFVTVANTRDLETEAAAAFVGMGLSYAAVAAFADHATLRTWVVVEKGRALWAFLTVLLAPLAFGAVLTGALLMIVDAAGLRTALPVALAALFVAWSIGQGRSFRSAIVRWPTPALSPAPRSPSGGVAAALRLMLTAALLCVVLVAQAALAGTSLLSASVGLVDVFLDQLALAGGLVALMVVGEVLTAEGRRRCANDRWTSRMLARWQVLALTFAAWHLGTAWRHITSEQPQVATAVEEIILMTVTVVMAVWSMTSRTRGSDLGLVRRSNALFWGLSFGYAYAGSVAMLSTVVQGVSGVLFLGHVVVAVTLLVLLRSTGPILAQRHATALEHAAMGAQVEARLSQRAEDGADASDEEASESSNQTQDVDVDEPSEAAPSSVASEDDDVIEMLD